MSNSHDTGSLEKRDQRRPVTRGRSDPRETFSRIILVGLALMVLGAMAFKEPVQPSGPAPLNELERRTAREIAVTTKISLQDAENLVLSSRTSDEDRRRWAADRATRDAEMQAMQTSFCKENSWSSRCR